MAHAADQGDPPDRATLAGRLLGHEAAWEHRGTGFQAGDAEVAALARSLWEVEGQGLAGPDADYATFLASFLDAYGST